MRVARFKDGKIVVKDVATPKPDRDEALIRILSAGVCHSDLHIVRGDWAGLPTSGAVELAASGRVKSHVGRLGALSDLGVILDELEAGQYVGRAVINNLAG